MATVAQVEARMGILEGDVVDLEGALVDRIEILETDEAIRDDLYDLNTKVEALQEERLGGSDLVEEVEEARPWGQVEVEERPVSVPLGGGWGLPGPRQAHPWGQ